MLVSLGKEKKSHFFPLEHVIFTNAAISLANICHETYIALSTTNCKKIKYSCNNQPQDERHFL